MKQFKECMSMHVNMESYYKSKAEFYQKQMEDVKEELVNIHHASWVATLSSGNDADNLGEVLFVHEQLDALLQEDWTPPRSIEDI